MTGMYAQSLMWAVVANAQRGHEGTCGIRTVIAGHRGLVDSPHPGRDPENRVAKMPITMFVMKPRTMKPAIDRDLPASR